MAYRLVEGLLKNKENNGLFGSKALSIFTKNIGLDKNEKNPKTIKGLISKKYPDDFLYYLI